MGNGGPGNPYEPGRESRQDGIDSDDWGTETLEMERNDGKHGTDDGLPSEWDDEELVTGSQYFSDDELKAIEEGPREAEPLGQSDMEVLPPPGAGHGTARGFGLGLPIKSVRTDAARHPRRYR